MNTKNAVRSLLWLIGTLVVGALGNGLWELAKPGLVWVGSAILDIATLGLTSLRDDIYVEVARGTYERAGATTMSALLGIIAGITLILFFTPVLMTFNKRTSDGQSAQQPSQQQSSKKQAIRWIFATFGMVIFLMLTVQTFRTIYVIRAANHMEQLHRVIAPYIGEDERLKFTSRFAAMKNRSQYLQLIDELSAIAGKNNLHLPDFSVY